MKIQTVDCLMGACQGTAQKHGINTNPFYATAAKLCHRLQNSVDFTENFTVCKAHISKSSKNIRINVLYAYMAVVTARFHR